MSEATSEKTSASLLQQLRGPTTGSAQHAWGRFVNLYAPLLLVWARRVGADDQEAADLVQEVFVILAREMPTFRHDPARRFRGWLWTVLRNKWRDLARRRATQPILGGLDDPEAVACPDNVEEFAEEEHRGYLTARALELMQAELPHAEWRACHEYVVKGRPATEVAQELGLTVNQVYLAKSRVLRRIRAELEGLLP